MKPKNPVLFTVAAIVFAATVFTQTATAQWAPLISRDFTCLTRMGTLIFGGYEGFPHGYIYRSYDEGLTWSSAYDGLDSATIVSLGTQGNILYAGTYERGIFRSLDSGKSWLPADSMDYFLEINAFASAGNVMFATGMLPQSFFSVILRSEDSGRHWREIIARPLGLEIYSLVIEDSTIYVSNKASYGYKSTDLGKTWIDMDPPEPYLLCLKGPYLFAATWGGSLVRSSDGGINWEELPITNYPEIANDGIVWLLAVDSNLLLCTDIPHSLVYRSRDNGETWSNYSEGISGNTSFWQLLATDHYIIAAGDRGLGCYRRPITDLASVSSPIPSSGTLTCSPNPARNIATLSYNAARITSVRCYDALGRVVLTRSHEASVLHSEGLSLDVSGLAAGIYSCQCTFKNGEVRTARMVVEK